MLRHGEVHSVASLVELELVDRDGEERLREISELDGSIGCVAPNVSLDGDAVGCLDPQRETIGGRNSGKDGKAHLIECKTEIVGSVTVQTGARRGFPEDQARDPQTRGVCRKVYLEQIIHGATVPRPFGLHTRLSSGEGGYGPDVAPSRGRLRATLRDIERGGGGVDNARVVVTMPADPSFLRLARLAAADAGTRAGFTVEDVEDLRLAIDELCGPLMNGRGGTISLTFVALDGRVDIEGRGPAPEDEPAYADIGDAIITAVVDEHDIESRDGVQSFRAVKRSSPEHASS